MLFFILRLLPARDYSMCYHLRFLGELMANHPSALKRYRQSQRRRLINQMNRHKLKTQIKRMRAALASAKKDDPKTLLPETFSMIDRSVQKGIIKKNTARRYKSRLAKRVTSPAA
jgi:small subunit ribosomal protein S20